MPGKNVLLINPETANKRPPLSLATLAAELLGKKRPVKIVDLNWEKESIFEQEAAGKPLLAVFWPETNQFKDCLKLAAKVRQKSPGTKIVFGGTHASALPEQTLSFPQIDYLLYGDGEKTLPRLADNVEKKKNAKISGVWTKKAGKISKTPAARIKNLDELPLPARHLLRLKKYSTKSTGRETTAVVTSRGCPYSCVYCYRWPARQKQYAAKSPVKIIEELGEIEKKYGIRGFCFLDDVFTLDKKRVEKLCEMLVLQKKDYRWECQTRADLVDQKLLGKMRQAGCVKIEYGVESGDEKSLFRIGKKISKKQIKKAFEWTKKTGMSTTAFFIIGMPWDTRESVEKTISFAKQLDPDFALFCVATPFPGSRLYELVGKKSSKNYEDYNYYSEKMDLGSLKAVFAPEKLSKKEVEKLVKKAYRDFWLYKLKNPKNIPRVLIRLVKTNNPTRLLGKIKNSLLGASG